jgi:hypothetical protein
MSVTGTAVIKVGQVAARLAVWAARRNEEQFVRERDEMFRWWVAQLAGAAKEQEERLAGLAATVADIEEKLAVLLDDPQHGRVVSNYGFEAAREAIDERRRMLAYAAAGSASPTLTVAQIARVERTLRELDPPDVLLLSELHQMAATVGPGAPHKPWLEGQRAFHKWQRSRPAGYLLLAAGCVYLHPPESGQTPEIHVPELGAWVLEVLDCYVAVRRSEPAG